MREDFKVYDEKMGKTIKVLKSEFDGIRAGRANPAVLDKITADYYGVPTPINQMAAISVAEARILVIQLGIRAHRRSLRRPFRNLTSASTPPMTEVSSVSRSLS